MVQEGSYCEGPDVVRFQQAWGWFERVGAADGMGGAQYFRAWGAWVAAGRPGTVGTWLYGWLVEDNRTPNLEVL
jgi:hypothetical protein